ncbi:hypothetical protein [Phytomonospora endophytica]|uniref:Uncharacterized protein n=1 Tax=Phytomonospora endophytica TaxID=714109 RepID=A0A841FMM9_9ACTN|nr:hypothetical protein [Phytomonospora endophytica]MBB6036163.1 hypothetical protein [Phytomonospora endophytica]GIG67067.1 hypothetical protein Pen01_33620 [Phytomonospora endophytica]
MTVQLVMVARYLLVVFAVGFEAHPPVPALVLLLVLASATVLVPALRGLVRAVLRALSSPAHGPPGPRLSGGSPEVRVPVAPGTPGTVRARAPSAGVHAFA